MMKDALGDLAKQALAFHLNVDPLVLDDTHDLEATFDLDSLDLILVTMRLEEQLGVEVPLALLAAVRTVGDFTQVLRSVDTSNPSLGKRHAAASDKSAEIRRERDRPRRAWRGRTARKTKTYQNLLQIVETELDL